MSGHKRAFPGRRNAHHDDQYRASVRFMSDKVCEFLRCHDCLFSRWCKDKKTLLSAKFIGHNNKKLRRRIIATANLINWIYERITVLQSSSQCRLFSVHRHLTDNCLRFEFQPQSLPSRQPDRALLSPHSRLPHL